MHMFISTLQNIQKDHLEISGVPFLCSLLLFGFLFCRLEQTLQPQIPYTVMHTATAKSFQSCLTLCDPIDGSPPGSTWWSWDSPGKNTGVGCHFFLQCMKVKSESEVVQSCPTLRDPMDCSLPGSSIHGIFQARVLEWVPLLSPGQG